MCRPDQGLTAFPDPQRQSPCLVFISPFHSLSHFLPSHLTQIHKSLFILFSQPFFFPSFSSSSPSLSVFVKYVQLDLAFSSSALTSPTQEREEGAAGFTQHEEEMEG